MRTSTLLSGLVLGLASSVAHGVIVDLTITASWLASDFDVSSTGPDFPIGDPQGNDDLVFGVAPSDGSTTFVLRVNTDFSTGLFSAGYLSNGVNALTHDMIGYTSVDLVGGVHTFGTATWMTGGILTDLHQVDALTASLWVDRDLTTGNPSRVRFRMFGTGDDLTADFFLGNETEVTISPGFLIAEYFGGEEVRSTDVVATVPAPAGAGLLLALGASVSRARRRD